MLAASTLRLATIAVGLLVFGRKTIHPSRHSCWIQGFGEAPPIFQKRKKPMGNKVRLTVPYCTRGKRRSHCLCRWFPFQCLFQLMNCEWHTRGVMVWQYHGWSIPRLGNEIAVGSSFFIWRKKSTCHQGMDEALRTKALSRCEGEKLRGRLQLASSQVFGRKFRRLLKVLSNHVTQGRKSLSEHTQACLSDIRKLLTQNAPSKIEASQAKVLHIYRGCLL